MEHPVLNLWEDLNEWSALDLGAFSNPGNESSHGSLVKSLSVGKDWEELLVPVMLVDFIASSLPSGEDISDLSVMLSVGSLKLSRVSVSLVVVEVNVPLWDLEWASSTTTASTAHLSGNEVDGIESSARA